jgi:hypothetical protein
MRRDPLSHNSKIKIDGSNMLAAKAFAEYDFTTRKE